MPATSATRLLRITHTTTYAYTQPVERSLHRALLRPIHDRRQRILTYRLQVTNSSPASEGVCDLFEFDDVFGNSAARFEVAGPYDKLTVRAESLVEILDADPFEFKLPEDRPTIPLNWLPRERVMLQPYLTSVELPDTQIDELFEYATGFVRRHNGDLMETLFAINLELYRNYKYVPGSTSLATTPYDVYLSKEGVCQDFAQLFICLARLLGVPARYVCGYLWTGRGRHGGEEQVEQQVSETGSRAPSDETHAWVQLYLPAIGWKGFDPTNGVLPQLDHVRLAYGRFWRDTAPLSGTLFGTPEGESLEVNVNVVEEEK